MFGIANFVGAAGILVIGITLMLKSPLSAILGGEL
jgi:hypothetical protein